jgi:hypothetical protein
MAENTSDSGKRTTSETVKRGLAFLVRMLGRISYAQTAIMQGVYFIATGIWPILSIDTFMMVTGPKTDIWLVKVVGLLIAVIGSVLLVAGLRWKISPEILLLGLGSALALAAVDIYYPATGVIAPIYLLDALIELAFAGLWISLRIRGKGNTECGTMFDPTISDRSQQIQ